MDAARRRFWWAAAGVVLLAFLIAAVFSAYLRPEMLVVYGDILSFCAALIR